MEKSFKQIVEALEDFCDNHLQIKSFDWGELNEITTKDRTYPLVWLNPTPGSNEGHLITLNFEMIVIDIVEQDFSNKKDVMNDCLFIINDVISNYWDNEETYGWTLNENGVTFTPYITNNDTDFCYGWVADISIEIENRLNSCAIPKII